MDVIHCFEAVGGVSFRWIQLFELTVVFALVSAKFKSVSRVTARSAQSLTIRNC